MLSFVARQSSSAHFHADDFPNENAADSSVFGYEILLRLITQPYITFSRQCSAQHPGATIPLFTYFGPIRAIFFFSYYGVLSQHSCAL